LGCKAVKKLPGQLLELENSGIHISYIPVYTYIDTYNVFIGFRAHE
jgi:hypothetical protein